MSIDELKKEVKSQIDAYDEEVRIKQSIVELSFKQIADAISNDRVTLIRNAAIYTYPALRNQTKNLEVEFSSGTKLTIQLETKINKDVRI